MTDFLIQVKVQALYKHTLFIQGFFSVWYVCLGGGDREIYLWNCTNLMVTEPCMWCRPVISILRRLRQEGCEFEASLGYMARPCTKKEKKILNSGSWFWCHLLEWVMSHSAFNSTRLAEFSFSGHIILPLWMCEIW
jgi:hypothetical protein